MFDPRGGLQREDVDLHFCGFHNLMPHRVQHVLLVSSLYESFILEEDGLISEMITSEFVDMKLSHAPRVARVSTGEQALSFIRQNPVDLVITMTRLGNLNVAELAKSVKEIKRILEEIVSDEDKKKPLSDSRMEKLITEKTGVKIARRTVAKYRESMGILSSSKRKEY